MFEKVISIIRRNKNFFLLWQGQAVSRFGTYLFDIAMIIWLTEVTGSAGMISLVLIASQVPEIIFAPLGGALADIYSRNRLLVISDIIGGISVLLLGAVLLIGLLPFWLNFSLIIMVSIILGLSAAVFNPASLALIPNIVKETNLQKANSLYQSTGKVSELAGQGLGGILLTVVGAPFLFIANGISFLLSALSESFIDISQAGKENTDEPSGKIFPKFYKNISDGLSFVKENESIKSIFYIIAVYHFFISPMPVLLPFYITETLQLPESWIGIILAVFSAGTISGLSFAGTKRGRISNLQGLIALMGLSAILFISAGLIPNLIVGFTSLLTLGFIIGIIIVNLFTSLQKIANKEVQGRLFGLLSTITNSAFPVGIAIYGFAVDLMRTHFSNSGITAQIVFSVNGFILLVFTLFIFSRKKLYESYILSTE